MSRRDIGLAPLHALLHDVEAVIIAAVRQIPRQRNRHPSNAAPYIQHVVLRLQSAVLCEQPAELQSDSLVIPVADKVHRARRNHLSPPRWHIGEIKRAEIQMLQRSPY